MADWQKKRNPDEVPTPIAVAVSDFCRRARAAASASEVRAALALLSEADDFRVRQLTDREPEATPLGPFALVDILHGASPAVAAQRQGCGYYELVRQLIRERDERTPEAPVVAPLHAAPAELLDIETRGRTPVAPPPVQEERTSRKAAKPTVQERIAPKKRGPLPAEPAEELEAEAEAEPEPMGFPKRELPKPRGRFTRLEATRTSVDELSNASSRDLLAHLITQHPHRMSLLKALGQQYAVRGGAPLSFLDVEPALKRHGLIDTLQGKERELVLASYTEHKGAHGRVAWALGVSPAELEKLVRALGINQEVSELRERFKREALAPQNLTYRLDLLGRTKYLSDLGIQRRFMDSLEKDLRAMCQGALADAGDVAALAEAVGRKHGAPSELVSRAMDRLGLTEEFRKRLSSESAPYSH